MKKFKLIFLFILFVNFSFAQNYLSITYLKVPRQNMKEFLTLHKELSEAAMNENRLIKGHFVYSHRHANNYSLVIVNTFDNPADIGKDQSVSASNLTSYANTLSENDKKSFNEKRSKWFRMYIEGHSDEVRTRRQNSGFQSEDFDPTKKSIVVVSWYNPKWSDLNEFSQLFEKQKFDNEKKLGNCQYAMSSGHYSGSGPTFSAAMWYPSWEAFAKNESDLDKLESENPENEDGARMWEIGGDHWDDILVSVGQMVDGKFVLAK